MWMLIAVCAVRRSTVSGWTQSGISHVFELKLWAGNCTQPALCAQLLRTEEMDAPATRHERSEDHMSEAEGCHVVRQSQLSGNAAPKIARGVWADGQ